jgi:hypothetical protein
MLPDSGRLFLCTGIAKDTVSKFYPIMGWCEVIKRVGAIMADE